MTTFSYNFKIPSLSNTEKYFLCTGYAKQYYNKYITNSIIQLFIQYSNNIHTLSDIKRVTPRSQFDTKIFDMFGCKWFLRFLQNGDPNDFKHNPFHPNVFTVRNSNQPHNHMVFISEPQAENLGLNNNNEVMITGTARSALFLLNTFLLRHINHGDILMNEVGCKNIGCKFGDKVSVHHSLLIPNGTSITIAPVIDAADSNHLNYLRAYFAGDRLPCKIGDCYTSERIEFQVVDIEVEDYILFQNMCIVNDKTIIYCDPPITRDRLKIHLDQPQIQLHLVEWGDNITKIDIGLTQVTVQELGEEYIERERGFTTTFDEYRKVFKWTNAEITIQGIQDLDTLTFTLDFERIDDYKTTDNVAKQSNNNDGDNDNDMINIGNIFSGIPLKLNEDNKNENNGKFDEIYQLKGKKLICNESDKMSRIKLIYIDGKNETLKVNLYTTIKQLYVHAKFVSGYETGFKLLGGVPPKSLEDFNATIQDTKLMGSRIIQKAI